MHLTGVGDHISVRTAFSSSLRDAAQESLLPILNEQGSDIGSSPPDTYTHQRGVRRARPALRWSAFKVSIREIFVQTEKNNLSLIIFQ